ncbi:phosphoenolpyruvate--protein phosphotransferase [Oscillibacter valericigenes]|uniref:phosphoenolpyruvate--protein phosphotransferase n=1 Tax=Oscillibacter valericigenes TaxID=351091 RepID=UPI0019592A7C|nr:phosphoenolpyruvate--protein phosphotransferase [Oscillibacter valericigenes]MBM6911161.1 phosphoenolpyruvate--protein phosphotransferase [Oscillibacter valericigenes]
MRYTGTAVFAGVVIGKVYLYERFVSDVSKCPMGTPAEEAAHYLAARDTAQGELETLCQHFTELGDNEKASIFSAHLEILSDETMDEEIQAGISGGESSGPWVIRSVYEQYASMFEQLADPIIRERAVDLRDVCARLLRCWEGLPEQNLSALPEPVIIITHDLVPSDTATLDRNNVLGIVTEIGGSTSHSAIIARSYEIPAVLGVSGIVSQLEDRQEVILDAVDGAILTGFDEEVRSAYEAKRREILRRQAHTKLYIDREPITPDGVRIAVELNIASAEPQNLEYAKYTDGVGLFRSEFLYMGRSALPTEEEQFQAYRKVLMTYGSRPVILRTLDIGGDKPLDCLDIPKEDNPFLGNRALRLCFQHPDMFRTQLRASLRASVYGNLWLMFPMVASMDDIRRAKSCLESAKAELTAEGIPFSPDLKVGIMVEIPAIAFLADQAAREVDFASIGTNDLTQYLTAVDRGNPEVRAYYQTYHPSLFRLIGYVVRSFAAQGKPVGVCGEMGGDPLAAAVLIGLGMRQLSMGAASVASIKQMILSTSCETAKALAETVCGLSTADEVRKYLKEHIDL